MNLQSMTSAGREPAAIMAALRRRFTVNTRRITPAKFQIECRDDNGRLRLRIPYLWVNKKWAWSYMILPGERP